MAIVGNPRWGGARLTGKFWDERPFSRVVRGRRAFLTVRDYVFLNHLEGQGVPRTCAQFTLNEIDAFRKKILTFGQWKTLSPPARSTFQRRDCFRKHATNTTHLRRVVFLEVQSKL
ncbi:MAG: hypothetical protein CL676_07400 [Bdellovibrionaceae bacterium]|nr:hypothetical protein [Pseudobdellovibrionaceae bacterium]